MAITRRYVGLRALVSERRALPIDTRVNALDRASVPDEAQRAVIDALRRPYFLAPTLPEQASLT